MLEDITMVFMGRLILVQLKPIHKIMEFTDRLVMQQTDTIMAFTED